MSRRKHIKLNKITASEGLERFRRNNSLVHIKLLSYLPFMLTITEAAEYFGMGTKVLRKFAADHQEVSIRYGKRWRIMWQELALEKKARKEKYSDC